MGILPKAVTHDGVNGLVGYPLRGVVQHGNNGDGNWCDVASPDLFMDACGASERLSGVLLGPVNAIDC
jgi:hypothetical protein